MAFADTDDLASYLQNPIGAEKTSAADLALDLATGLIKADLAQAVEQATSTETFAPTRSRLIVLPELPVTDVESVVHGGQTLVEDDDYTWSRIGIITREGTYWPEETVVTYTHGYLPADIPAAIKAVCLSVAARLYGNPHGYDSKSGDNFTVTYPRSEGGLTEAERRILNPFRP